ncbi:inner membrane-spanning protein YciB [Acuticoccus sp.]|uniref:inner membrane-spanning protein YciB n=1 Tax=Acuticoccus sp. TaxID=1904378 RepID=UPI003B526500
MTDTTTPWARVNKAKLFERFAIEIGPALVFVVSLQLMNLNLATILFVVATAVAASYSWFEKGHFPYIPAGMVILAALFGALTVVLGDADYIQFRATVVNAGGALAILIGLVFGQLLLKRSLQDGFRLTDGAWWVLSLRMVIYLALMAALNEVVWRTMSVEFWAWFKTIAPVFNLVFLAINWPLIRDNLHAEEGAELTESPPAGAKSSFNPATRGA